MEVSAYSNSLLEERVIEVGIGYIFGTKLGTKGRMSWTKITVPKDLAEELKKKAKEEDIAIHEYIKRFMVPKEKVPMVPKVPKEEQGISKKTIRETIDRYAYRK
jgi:hypothetical protein